MQVSSGKVTRQGRRLAGRRASRRSLDKAGLKRRLRPVRRQLGARRASPTLDAQRKAKDAIGAALNPDPSDPTYIVALNLLSRSPQWLTALHALPMYLGLDLRGGVHFLMQVDMKAALTKKAESHRRRRAHAAARQEHPPRRHRARRQRRRRALPRPRDADDGAQRCWPTSCPTSHWLESADGTDFKLAGNAQARGRRARAGRRRSRRTSRRCTTASTSSAWPSR